MRKFRGFLDFFFLALSFAISFDLLALISIKGQLETVSVTVREQVAIYGSVTESLKREIEEQEGIAIVALEEEEDGLMGSLFYFALRKNYRPLVIGQGEIVVQVTKSAIVGYGR